jgi:adenine/guanine/hypoxanthine permease
MKISGGMLIPKDYGRKQYWTWKPAGKKPVIFRLFTKGRFWGSNPKPEGPPGFQLNEIDCASSIKPGSHAESTVEEKFTTREPSPAPFRTTH